MMPHMNVMHLQEFCSWAGFSRHTLTKCIEQGFVHTKKDGNFVVVDVPKTLASVRALDPNAHPSLTALIARAQPAPPPREITPWR